MLETNKKLIEFATNGLNLSESEKKSLNWLTACEQSTVENICQVIEKAKQSTEKGFRGIKATCKSDDDGVGVSIRMEVSPIELESSLRAVFVTMSKDKDVHLSIVASALLGAFTDDKLDTIKLLIKLAKEVDYRGSKMSLGEILS